MNSEFTELNLFVYHSMVNLILDLVIWCLGPYVDDSREYGFCRRLLAAVTRKLCCAWLAFRGELQNDV